MGLAEGAMRRSRTVIVLMLATLMGGVPEVSAQTMFQQGERVRITKVEARAEREVSLELGAFLTAPHRFTGTVVSSDQRHLFVELSNGKTARAPRNLISRIEVSEGRTHSAKQGFAVGAVLGGLLGAASTCVFGCQGTGTTAGGAALGGAVVGSFGALVGWLIKKDRWEEVRAGPQITLTLPERGIGAQVRLGW